LTKKTSAICGTGRNEMGPKEEKDSHYEGNMVVDLKLKCDRKGQAPTCKRKKKGGGHVVKRGRGEKKKTLR